MNWQIKRFSELTLEQLYDLLKLRVDVFVVEQQCYYPELDNKDRHADTLHLFCYQQQTITAYLRILPKGVEYNDYLAIGRVIVASVTRGTGLGHQLMQQALTLCHQYWPTSHIKISAQQHLEPFYQQHGFVPCSTSYLEDNIPHIAMLKLAQCATNH
jgi:ElaA protein